MGMMGAMVLGAGSGWGQVETWRMPRDTWPYWVVGVPGGCSNYPVCVNVMDYGAAGNGTTDDSTAFANAIAACTNGGAVYVPAGSYLLNSVINWTHAKRWVLRGAGPNQTWLICGAGNHAFTFGGDTTRAASTVSSGYTRGSTTLTVATPANVHVGDLIRFWQDDDSDTTYSQDNGVGPTSGHRFQQFVCMAKNGSDITISAPIYYTNFQSSYNPRLEAFTQQAIGCGIEDLGMTASNSSCSTLIYFYIAQDCWLKNIAVTNSTLMQVAVLNGYRIEIRDSMFYYHRSYDTTDRNSVHLQQMSTDCLVENNIGQFNNGSFNAQGTVGCVIGYNWSIHGLPTGTSFAGGDSSHGYGAYFLLFECNAGPWISLDNTWGGNCRTTVFRNWCHRLDYWDYSTGHDSSQNRGPGCYNDASCYNNNWVGNIVSRPEDSGATLAQQYEVNAERGGPDSQVAATIFMHGNFDYGTGSTGWSNSISHSLSNSYYLTAKPGWWGNLTNWPAFGPDVCTDSTITNWPRLPAQYREQFGTNPPAGGGGAVPVRFRGGAGTIRSGRI